MTAETEYTIADLARLAGLNVRTIRYWLAQGLIPASGESGPGAHYGQGHLDRLTLIKRLQTEYLPNAEIRRRLAPLSDAEVAALLASDAPGIDPSRPTTTALEYVRGLLQQPEVAVPLAGAASPALSRPPLPLPSRTPSPPPRHPAGSAPGIGPRFTAALRGREVRKPRPIRTDADSADASADASTHEMEPSAGTAPADTATRPDGDRRPGPLGLVASVAEVPIEAGSPGYAPTAARTTTERSQWERLSLGENIELHIRRPLSRPEQRRVERLITIARQVLDEDKA